MTWLAQFYLRAFAILLQVACIITDDTQSHKPIILVPPQDLTVTAANVTVTCISSGSEPRNTVWQKDGANLDIGSLSYLRKAPDGSLFILFAARQRDEGFYRCIVSNAVGTVFSLEAHITFPFMESFSMPESRIAVQEGSRALLKCYAPKSYPDKHIYWSKYDPKHPSNPITLQSMDNAHYSTNDNGDLYFSYTKTSDAGGYFCNVENHYVGRVQRRKIVLTVEPMDSQSNVSPEIWYLNRQRALNGQKFVLECIAFGRPVPSVQLRKVGSSTLLGSRDGNSRKFVFERFTIMDEGAYECEAANPFGEVDRRTTTINMDSAPVLIITPDDMKTSINSVATLLCLAEGVPTVSYQWFFNGDAVPFGREYALQGGNLTILRVQTHHSGMYQCVAGNEHGDVVASARLYVIEVPANFGPGSIAPLANTHVLVGKTAELSCSPSGAPRPVVRWRKGRNTELTTDDKYTILPNGNLIISNIVQQDEGKYLCIATNRLGRASRSGWLSVRANIAITNPPAAQQRVVLGKSLNLTCGVQTASILEIAFQWKKNTLPLRPNSRVYVTRTGRQVSMLIIKSAEMTDTGAYSCVAMATGAAGAHDTAYSYITVVGPSGNKIPPDLVHTSKPSNGQTTGTPVPGQPRLKGVPGRPADVTVKALQEKRKAEVFWVLGRDNYSPIRKVYIQFRSAFELRRWIDLDWTNNTQSMASMVVTLSPWVAYKFRVIAENGVGNSTPSLETEDWLRTPPSAPDKYPVEVRSQGTGPNEITVSWKPLPTIDQNGPGIYYIVLHRLAGSTQPMYVDEVRNGQTSIRLKGRDFYVQYQYTVQAGNDLGLGPRGPLMTGYTGERLPLGVPKDLQVQITSSTTAIAWWRGVRADRTTIRGEFLGYKLYVWAGDAISKSTEATWKTTRANRTTVLLQPFTSYLFQVVAYNKHGNGPGSNIVGPLKTPEDLPEHPSRVYVSYAEMGKANITWLPPNRTNGVIVGFVLKYREFMTSDTKTKLIDGGMNTWTIVRDLKPAAKYEFSVAANTRAGTGKPATALFDFTWLPTARPSGLRVGALGVTTVVLTWTPVNRPSIIGYKVYYWQENTAREESITKYEYDGDILTTVNNLEGGTTYFFQVAALNRYGGGPKTAPLRVTTDVEKVTRDPKVVENGKREKGNGSGSNKFHPRCHVVLILCCWLASLLVNR